MRISDIYGKDKDKYIEKERERERERETFQFSHNRFTVAFHAQLTRPWLFDRYSERTAFREQPASRHS